MKVLIDHALEPRSLNHFDLWIAWLVGVVYLIYYLIELDAKGFHFYIILTPRSHFCIFVYSLAIGMYYGIFQCYRRLNAELPASFGLPLA